MYIANTPSKLQMSKPDMLNIEHDFMEKYLSCIIYGQVWLHGLHLELDRCHGFCAAALVVSTIFRYNLKFAAYVAR